MPAVLQRNAHALKTQKGLTEKPIAKKGGVGVGTVNRVMNGQNVRLNVLAGIAKGLGVPAWTLLLPEFHPDDPPVATTRVEMEAAIAAQLDARWEAAKEMMEAIWKDRPPGADSSPPWPTFGRQQNRAKGGKG